MPGHTVPTARVQFTTLPKSKPHSRLVKGVSFPNPHLCFGVFNVKSSVPFMAIRPHLRLRKMFRLRKLARISQRKFKHSCTSQGVSGLVVRVSHS